MRRLASFFSPGVALAGAVLLFLGIGLSQAAPSAQVPESHTPNYVTPATIRDIMAAIIDPAADAVWNAVMIEVGPDGIVETVPKTDEEWQTARRGALTVIEATNLIVMPNRRVAAPGEGSAAPGDELHPDEIAKMISEDPRRWTNMAYGLRAAMNEALKAIDTRDADKLFEIGERIEFACESCHMTFWYPNQRLPPGYYDSAR